MGIPYLRHPGGGRGPAQAGAPVRSSARGPGLPLSRGRRKQSGGLSRARRPSRATGRAPRYRRCRPSRRTRCAGPAGHRDSRRCHRRRLPFRAAPAIFLMNASSAPSTVRQTLVFERDRRIGGEMAEPVALGDDRVERGGIGVGARDQPVERRRSTCAHSSAKIASSTASIDGVLIVSPLNTPSAACPWRSRRNTLGSGQAGV